MDINKSIEKTKICFEKSFNEKTFYEKQTKDEKHLNIILDMIDIKSGDTVLDLGTGSGFLAFPSAEIYKEAEIIGLDIVNETLKLNRKIAEEKGIKNIKFIEYDGLKFPLEDKSVDVVMTRYALHHFPCIQDTFFEISRVLKDEGILFISDPTPNEEDDERFVDQFMQLKPDGHIKFYTLDEFVDIGHKAGLKFVLNKNTRIRFPRVNTNEYKKLLAEKNKDILMKYEIECINNEVFISENVLNIIFRKNK